MDAVDKFNDDDHERRISALEAALGVEERAAAVAGNQEEEAA